MAGVHGRAGGVDDIGDGADTAERDGDHVMELHPGDGGYFERPRRDHCRVGGEVAVAAQTTGLTGGDTRGDLVGRVAVRAAVHPGGLVRWVVWHLVLEEVRLPAVAVPDDLRLLVMLDEQA